MKLRKGSLFTGTGALDIAVMDVFDAELAWVSQYEPPDKNGKEDTNQYAAQILKRHWPDIPNLGDITLVDWQAVLTEHGPIDILTGGFPCTDVSSAGKRAGLTPGTRSGLWNHMAYAISVLNPRLVIIENVEGLLSAPADRGLGLDAEALEEEARAGRILRALGAVLGDLASLGFHAEWARVAASEVGAPHQRKRVFIYAWPVAVDPSGIGRGDGPGIVGRLGSAGRDAEASADTTDVGHEWVRGARDGRAGPAHGGFAAANAQGEGLQGLRPEPARGGPERGGASAADADGRGREGHQERDGSPDHGQPERERGLEAVGRGVRRAVVEPVRAGPELGRADEASADTTSVGRREGRPESAWEQGRSDAAECGGTAPSDADYFGRRADVLQLRPGKPDLDWGDYGPAIRRWEAVIGRPAPWPTDALGRLSPVFTEWLMGLPDGWVTCTPGLTRSAMLRALGNGVVWQQAAAAIRLLHQRATADAQQAAA